MRAHTDWVAASTNHSCWGSSLGDLDLYKPSKAESTAPTGAVAVDIIESIPTATRVGGL
jgi:hypothetical protein